jgi:hypothetical protein
LNNFGRDMFEFQFWFYLKIYEFMATKFLLFEIYLCWSDHETPVIINQNIFRLNKYV